jgi:hypothetical protein
MRDIKSGANLYDIARDVLSQSADLLSSQDVLHLEGMTAEARVQFFDKLAPMLGKSDRGQDRLDSAFALALAAFICRPGLEQQAGLLREHALRLPEAWLWLGALQAFSPLSDSLTLNSGGGWRIARELFRPEEPWSSPRADAAITEMDVLSRSKSRVMERLVSRARLDVEIYPMITIAVRGQNVIMEQQQSDERRYAEYVASRDSMASAKLELVEARLEESLRLLRELRRNGVGSGTKPGRKRR